MLELGLAIQTSPSESLCCGFVFVPHVFILMSSISIEHEAHTNGTLYDVEQFCPLTVFIQFSVYMY